MGVSGLMHADEQGVRAARRYQVIPRTLVLLSSINPETQAREVLLMKGAPDKRLWANHYNGLGGHVEGDEDILAAAQREVEEETGLFVPSVRLRGVVNINTGHDEQGPRPGVIMFVFAGETQTRTVRPSAEGTAEWLPIDNLEDYPLVDDLYDLVPLALDGDAYFYGYYTPRADGTMAYHFR